MKAPDKIYLREYHENVVGEVWKLEPSSNNRIINHEYIRKDALTERVTKRLQELWDSSSAQDEHDAYYKNPVVKELKDIVNVINSL